MVFCFLPRDRISGPFLCLLFVLQSTPAWDPGVYGDGAAAHLYTHTHARRQVMEIITHLLFLHAWILGGKKGVLRSRLRCRAQIHVST